MFDAFKRTKLAVKLLTHQARIAIVHAETAIPKADLRELYRQIHLASPPRGQLKFSLQRLFRNNVLYREAILFSDILRLAQCGKEIDCTVDAYEVYKRLRPRGGLDFSTAWVLARNIRMGMISRTRCECCGSSILLGVRDTRIERCAICKTPVVGTGGIDPHKLPCLVAL